MAKNSGKGNFVYANTPEAEASKQTVDNAPTRSGQVPDSKTVNPKKYTGSTGPSTTGAAATGGTSGLAQ